jgi:hypothetical protein
MVEYGELRDAGNSGDGADSRKDDRKKINCFHCVNFVVTWDPKMPKGCRVFGFKGKDLPSLSVYLATGKNCIAFKRRKTE